MVNSSSTGSKHGPCLLRLVAVDHIQWVLIVRWYNCLVTNLVHIAIGIYQDTMQYMLLVPGTDTVEHVFLENNIEMIILVALLEKPLCILCGTSAVCSTSLCY